MICILQGVSFTPQRAISKIVTPNSNVLDMTVLFACGQGAKVHFSNVTESENFYFATE